MIARTIPWYCLLLALLPGLVTGAGQGDVRFVVLGKTANYRQSHDSSHELLNYHFFAEIFLKKDGAVRNASLFPPGKGAAPMLFTGNASVLEVHGGRYASEPELDRAFPDGDYVFSYILSDGNAARQSVAIRKGEGASRIPTAITVYFSQDRQPVTPTNIDPGKDLVVSWSPFRSGNADARGIVNDLVFVVTGNCHGAKIDHSGGPFGEGDYLDYAASGYVIAASKLYPGEAFQVFVEQAEMDSGRQGLIPTIATYASTTFIDIKTSGQQQADRAECPSLMPAMDGGQTDRPAAKQDGEKSG